MLPHVAGRHALSTRNLITAVFGFITGFLFALSVVLYSVPFTKLLASAPENLASVQVQRRDSAFGVSSLMKDFNCGFANQEVPHFLKHSKGEHKVIIDVGLKDGAETMAAVRSGFVVYAFEPVKEFVSKVASSMSKRKLDFFLVPLDERGVMQEGIPSPRPGKGIAYIFQAAAGSAFQTKTIYVDGPGTSFTDPEATKGGYKEEVQVVRISDYVKTDVYYFKIDAQGWDYEVIRGALDLIRNYVVRLISVEFWPKGLSQSGSSASQILDLIVKQTGYICFDTRTRKGTELGHVESIAGYMNMIQGLSDDTSDQRYGFFDDLTCLSPNFARYLHGNTVS